MQTKPNLAIPTLSLFLLLAGAYTFLTIAMIWSELPYWFVALCLVGLAYGSFTVMHEASHRLLWRKQPNLEIWLGRLASLPLGIPTVYLFIIICNITLLPIGVIRIPMRLLLAHYG